MNKYKKLIKARMMTRINLSKKDIALYATLNNHLELSTVKSVRDAVQHMTIIVLGLVYYKILYYILKLIKGTCIAEKNRCNFYWFLFF